MCSFVWYQGQSSNSDRFLFLSAHDASNRVIEIEWAVKNGTEFIPTPKKPRKAKRTKAGKGKTAAVGKVMNGDEDEENIPINGIHQMLEGDSSGSINPLKRFQVMEDVAQVVSETPQKKVKCEVIVEEEMM